MATYFILTNSGILYELDSTSNITLSHTGDSTDFPVEDGSSVSDNYINRNSTISFTGRISDIKTFSTRLNSPTTTYIKGLEDLKKSKELFTVFHSKSLKSVRDELSQCIFLNLEISQDNKNGILNNTSSYLISFTAKQIKLASAAVVLNKVPKEAFVDITEEKETFNGNTNSLEEDDIDKIEEDTADLWRRMQENASQFSLGT